ncbi:MAG: phosphatase PAP2 family protein [Bradymonadales bacterium]|jgi:undecaprenyl-diphosphatase
MQGEISVLNAIQEHCRFDALDHIMVYITKLGDLGAIWILLTVVLLIVPKTRSVGLCMFLALLLDSLLLNLALKPLIARPRPFSVNETVSLLIAKPSDFSFPSGHSGASFAAAFAILFSKARKALWIPALCLAVLIAFSRLYLYVHYPSDVLAGAIIGVLSAFIAIKLILYAKKRRLAAVKMTKNTKNETN